MVEGAPRSKSLKVLGGSQTRPSFLTMKYIAILFTLFIVLIIVLADAGRLSILAFINSIPYADKVGHFVLYGILTLLVDLTVLGGRLKTTPKLIVIQWGLILALLIGLEEFSQRYFQSRHSDIVDLTASYAGVIFFSWLALRINKK
jgi:hypothetical protein